ncbi:OLC1v1000695C1 [Oldenlandia corymbosa var. corymbosa]|uniref:tRNA (guanine(9)-N(1))-methyltransferase n=1 Tax=Oldenlandia corymbosa var. corymbosa TaxID=529605 RepID=A0AAV1D608_OLDCO|nr:OLC1v1000695C1 [Oldenlandia corymbosa var. corymbosa]
MESAPESGETTTTATVDPCGVKPTFTDEEEKPMSKNAKKKLLKQQRYEAKKAEKKAMEKEAKKREKERKQREWEEKLGMAATEEERQKLIESRKELRKERMEQRCQEKESKLERLKKARLDGGQKIVIDLEFAHLMNTSQLNSLVQQIMYCYAVNGRCEYPAHLFLTGCEGEMHNHLQRLPGYEKWVIDKENRSYIQAFEDQKENLVYLTADSETTLEELDPKKIYIIGGLVDRNRWKGITLDKAKNQGIQTAKLPIGSYLKMSSSQVLTVNQVLEILLKYLETRDWKASFFQVVPQRKRCGDAESESDHHDAEEETNGERDDVELKRQCIGA